ncbi:MAG: hypothetical protein P1U83_17355 [Roseovarius sp.]|nr:hypothetical protein [Roseovarius sp.]
MALHAPGSEGDERNHHAHIMLTTRFIGADRFEGKERSWNSKELLGNGARAGPIMPTPTLIETAKLNNVDP